MVQLGDMVRDTITDFEGIAIARSEWLGGCVRIGVQNKQMKDGKPVEETWFDENRLFIILHNSKTNQSTITGGPAREGRKTIEG